MSSYNVPFHLQNDYSHDNAEASVGKTAPDFTLKGIDGQSVQLSDYRNKAHVILVFGSTT